MARTLVQIQREMEKLQKEAELVKASEVAGVIARIKSAIDFYGITEADLFGNKAAGVARDARKNSRHKDVKPSKTQSPAKYRDKESGKTWTGHGMRPRWFVKAIESGITAADMAI